MHSSHDHDYKNNLVPKKLHAIWLGGILGEVGKENIGKWKEKNPDYEAYLWIDSSTFLKKDSKDKKKYHEQQKQYSELKSWAKKNKINIVDVNPNSESHSVQHRPDIVKEMSAKEYYTDEITNPGENYGAAADILRVEILHKEGGVYVDAEDINPGKKPLGDIWIDNRYDILFKVLYENSEYELNNDVIVSLPYGQGIAQYRENILKNYQNLYNQPNRFLTAHRYYNLASFRTYTETGKIADKFQTTLSLAGPNALAITMLDLMNIKRSDYSVSSGHAYSDFQQDTDTFISQKHASSWLDKDPRLNKNEEENYKNISAFFRNNVVEYFNLYIESMLAENKDDELKQALLKLYGVINADFHKQIPLTHLTKNSFFTDDEIAKLNSVNGLFDHFKETAESAEKLLLYCEFSKIKARDFYLFLDQKFANTISPQSFTEQLENQMSNNILHFFNHELNKGFYEILKDPNNNKQRNNGSKQLKQDFTPDEIKELDQLVEKKFNELLAKNEANFYAEPLLDYSSDDSYEEYSSEEESRIIFDSQNFSNKNFSGENIQGKSFGGMNLTNTSWQGCLLSNVIFYDADLTNANFCGVEHLDVKTLLSTKSLRNIKIDKKTLDNNYFTVEDIKTLQEKIVKDYENFYKETKDPTSIIHLIFQLIKDNENILKLDPEAVIFDYDNTSYYHEVVNSGKKQLIELLEHTNVNQLSDEIYKELETIANTSTIPLKMAIFNFFSNEKDIDDKLKKCLAIKSIRPDSS